MHTDKKAPGSPLGDETGGLYTKGLRFFLGEEAIDLIDQFVAIHTVNHAGLLNGLASGRRAAQAMHADFKEEAGSLHVDLQHIGDNHIFGNHFCHVYNSFLPIPGLKLYIV